MLGHHERNRPVTEEVNKDGEDIQLRLVITLSEKLKFHVLHQIRQLVALVLMNATPYAVQTNINHFNLK